MRFPQSKGDRLYLDEGIKLNVQLVETLKKMNSTYPQQTSDYDAEFIYNAMKPMFSRAELGGCLKFNSLHYLKKDFRSFLKGSITIFIFEDNFILYFCLSDFSSILVLFMVRVGGDNTRLGTLREHIMHNARFILKKK